MTSADPAVPVPRAAERDAAHLRRAPSDGAGCRSCGLPAHEHGIHLIHRFVRPDLPFGHQCPDQTAVGDEIVTGQEIGVGRPTGVAGLGLSGDAGLPQLRTAPSDCWLLDATTICAAR